MDAQAQLDGFIDKFTPEIAALTRALLARLIARFPSATMPVYDNYQALAIGFGGSERVKHVVVSLAVMARKVSLCFNYGVGLDDPDGLLTGGGNQVRFLSLPNVEVLDDPRVETLIAAALAKAELPIDAGTPGLVIKSVSVKQRPRRP